jgi:hypothetical protein
LLHWEGDENGGMTEFMTEAPITGKDSEVRVSETLTPARETRALPKAVYCSAAASCS